MRIIPASRELAEFVSFTPYGNYDGLLSEGTVMGSTKRWIFEGELWARYDSTQHHEAQATAMCVRIFNPQQPAVDIRYWKEDKS